MKHSAALLGFGLLLPACATRSEFSDLPERYRTPLFVEACHGNPHALHCYFTQAKEPPDGEAGEGFDASVIAIMNYMGKDAFYAALRKEPYDIQKAVSVCLP